MQPYFVPYIGYFQLMASADKFVLLDDVNYINRGWINRNRIAVGGEPAWLTLPLVKASQNRLINEIEIADDPVWRKKMTRTVVLNYGRAPFANEILALFSTMLEDARGSLSAFLFRHLDQLARYLNLKTRIEPSSAIYPKENLTGQERILDICRREGATSYVNLPGGRDLYDPQIFASAGVELLFLQTNLEAMTLQHSGPEPSLSILDLLMLNPVAAVNEAIDTRALLPH